MTIPGSGQTAIYLALLALLAGACAGTPPVSRAPTPEEVRALLAKGPGSNIAVTSDSSRDSLLADKRLGAPPELVRESLLDAIRKLPRWHVADHNASVIWATRTTRIFRFVDDVYILVEADGRGTRLRVRSASRLGEGDLGQNARNIAELFAALDAWVERHFTAPPPPRAEG
ncbi:MAG: DUF1499 domain-containing protein [Gemmatimonadales bacterium]|nr:DUF1499 domain-containing protein [Gemmatimonadales bacterium]